MEMVGAQSLQVPDCHFEDVRLLELGVARSLVVGLEDERLELVEAVVDSRAPLLLHDRLVALPLERLLAHLFHLHVDPHA